MINLQNLLKIAIHASVIAGEKILSIYNSDIYDVKIKSDNSPITLADSEANKIITDLLEKTKLPVLTEENKIIPFSIRQKWEYYWLVDPLDGTKEFIKKNGEFTVNIALIKRNSPVLGVIYVPVTGNLYFSTLPTGSFKITNANSFYNKNEIQLDEIISKAVKLPIYHKGGKFRIIGSRSHRNSDTDEIINKLKEKFGDIEIISSGSSIKFCLMAEGSADCYPRYAPTMEWDTAAGHAIAAAAGCSVTKIDGISPLEYNKENLLNPWFIVKSSDF
jgi:3'(2'), 5'-bisphosphate nucleotidase